MWIRKGAYLDKPENSFKYMPRWNKYGPFEEELDKIKGYINSLK